MAALGRLNLNIRCIKKRSAGLFKGIDDPCAGPFLIARRLTVKGHPGFTSRTAGLCRYPQFFVSKGKSKRGVNRAAGRVAREGFRKHTVFIAVKRDAGL